MAFKVDFSKLNRGTRAPESPYAYTDDMHFARNFKDEEPRRGTVKVTLNQRTITICFIQSTAAVYLHYPSWR